MFSAPSAAAPASAPSAEPASHPVYRSSALEETAPVLANSVDSVKASSCAAILAANRTAEQVREEFKRKRGRGAPTGGKSVPANSEEAEKAGRYDRRLKMNRQSAAASRVRREAYIKALEQQLVLQDEKYSRLAADLAAERSAHQKLRKDVESARALAHKSEPQISESYASVSVATSAAPDAEPAAAVDGALPVDLLFSAELNGPTAASAELTYQLAGADCDESALFAASNYVGLGLPLATDVPPDLLAATAPSSQDATNYVDRLLDLDGN